jgi:hypothetical protein
MSGREPWFRPKRFGYGAEPAGWKGWAATAGFILLLAGWSFGLLGVARHGAIEPAAWIAWLVGVVALTAAFIALARAKTDGEWRWRGTPGEPRRDDDVK